MQIRFIKANETHALRHLVLRPHQTIEDCDYPNDRNPDSFHVGLFLQGELVCIGSFYNEKQEQLRGWKQYRLRGMATHPEQRSKGLGSKLMRFAMDHLINQKADLLWCNARENALEFYKRLGFAIEGPPFDVPGIGEHFLMHRKLP